ncbi:hypothetical protein MTR_1g098190 [Medicago truncatula]|uniref:Uncharacterized protein n=1 Tax=Medicago truncatula TaxID=3880 RepID=G7IBU8_MEDTR|nr:hypothetical protein MTR_1g098190 [Medicago truncatula]
MYLIFSQSIFYPKELNYLSLTTLTGISYAAQPLAVEEILSVPSFRNNDDEANHIFNEFQKATMVAASYPTTIKNHPKGENNRDILIMVIVGALLI